MQLGTLGKSCWLCGHTQAPGDGMVIEGMGKVARSATQDGRGRSVPSEYVIAVRLSPTSRSLPWSAQCSHLRVPSAYKGYWTKR